jgi:hypothetical protein
MYSLKILDFFLSKWQNLKANMKDNQAQGEASSSPEISYSSSKREIFVSGFGAGSEGSFFGPPGSFVRARYGSGSFYHQARIARKTLIPTDSL